MTHPYQPSEKPVAFAAGLDCNDRGFLDVMAWSDGEFTTPLFTASQLAAEVERAVAAERKPLTRQQIGDLSAQAQINFCLDKRPSWEVALARLIEQAHGIKPPEPGLNEPPSAIRKGADDATGT